MNDSIKVKIITAEDIDAQNSPNSNFNSLINPQIAFRLPFVPTAFSFAVMVIVKGLTSNLDYKIRIYIQDIVEGKIQYDTGISPLHIQNVTDNFNFNLHLKNIPFYKQGEYKVVFELDGKEYSDTFDIIANEELNVTTNK